MLEWKIKVNDKVLTREQKLAAMMQLGLLTEDTFQQALEVSHDSPADDTKIDRRLGAVQRFSQRPRNIREGRASVSTARRAS